MSALSKYLRAAGGIAAAAAMILFLLFPQRYSQSLLQGISLWAACVLPVAFPFMFLTALFTKTSLFRGISRLLSPAAERLFRVSGAGGALAVVSAFSGYPVGAKLVLEHTRRTGDKSEAFRLALLCSVSGPSFLVGSLGGAMFRSAAAGWIALLSHLAGVWLVCIPLGMRTRPHPRSAPTATEDSPLSESVMQSVLSVLCVGGFIALFSVLLQMLTDLHLLSALSAPFGRHATTAEAFFCGLLEMTSGCARLAQSPSPFSLALCVFLVTLGGACVLLQQFAYLSAAGVRCLPFLAVKAAQATLAALIAFPLSLLFGVQ